MSATYQLDIVRMVEYLRALVRRENKQQLVMKTEIPYTRLIYFARSANSMPNAADLTVLIRHFMPEMTFVVKRLGQVTSAAPITPEAAAAAAEAAISDGIRHTAGTIMTAETQVAA